jgi:hypothetical protein
LIKPDGLVKPNPSGLSVFAGTFYLKNSLTYCLHAKVFAKRKQQDSLCIFVNSITFVP